MVTASRWLAAMAPPGGPSAKAADEARCDPPPDIRRGTATSPSQTTQPDQTSPAPPIPERTMTDRPLTDLERQTRDFQRQARELMAAYPPHAHRGMNALDFADLAAHLDWPVET